jgi:hypothetical protein
LPCASSEQAIEDRERADQHFQRAAELLGGAKDVQSGRYLWGCSRISVDAQTWVRAARSGFHVNCRGGPRGRFVSIALVLTGRAGRRGRGALRGFMSKKRSTPDQGMHGA